MPDSVRSMMGSWSAIASLHQIAVLCQVQPTDDKSDHCKFHWASMVKASGDENPDLGIGGSSRLE